MRYHAFVATRLPGVHNNMAVTLSEYAPFLERLKEIVEGFASHGMEVDLDPIAVSQEGVLRLSVKCAHYKGVFMEIDKEGTAVLERCGARSTPWYVGKPMPRTTSSSCVDVDDGH